MSAAEPILEAAAIRVQAGVARLLDGVSLTLRGGETVAIVGPNGAGKSTLLRTLSGDLRPQGGDIRLKGRTLLARSPRELAAHRAMLSQHVSVSFPFTVEEVVTMGAGDRPRAQAQGVIDDTIEELELGPFRHRELPTLSGGEQQRAHFARVLIQLTCGEIDNGPGLLLLDEPTSSLDLRHQIDLVEIAQRRARAGTAVVAVLHDLNLAARFADRIVVMHRGRIAADGGLGETFTSEMIRTVFEIDTTVGRDDGRPYVLLQRMKRV